jgi:hypothetical protein
MLFGEIDSNELRTFSRSLFQNYENWIDRDDHALAHVAIDHQGVLPGDFVASDVAGGFKVGIIGINSTFRHLSNYATEGGLTISPQQVQRAAGGDLPKWSLDQDISIALTHHPFSWMANRSDSEDALFNGASTTRLHLCGHLHLERYSSHAIGTNNGRLTHQGQSLFGIEQIVGPTGTVDRQHGYALVTLEKQETGVSAIVWPRKGERLNDGTWNFDRHAAFGLPKNSNHSVPIYLSTPTLLKKTQGVLANNLNSKRQTTSLTSTDDAISEFLQEFKRGFMVAVVGDRFVEGRSGDELACNRFERALWDSLDTGEAFDSSLSMDQLLHLSADRSKPVTETIMAEMLGNPSQDTISRLDQLVKSPWAAILYLSPLRDLENCPSLSSANSPVSIIDGTEAPYRIPLQGDEFVLRLASPAAQGGSTNLRLDEALAHRPENSSSDWRRYAKQLLSRSPSVYLTDSVNSLSMWQWIVDRKSADSDYRLPAFLICPELPPQMQMLLKRYGVKWISSSVDSFTKNYLVSSRVEYGQAKAAIQKRRKRAESQTPLAIGALRTAEDRGSRDYLLGSSPTWGDITGGYAARLSSQQRIMSRINEAAERSMILVTGTAGAGRTTSLMQCALDLQSSNKSVAWIDPAVSREKISEIVDQVVEEDYDYVFVDDVDVFGAQAERLLSGLRGGEISRRIVVAGTRSVRTFLVEGLSFSHTISVGNLTSSDLDQIVNVLRRNRAMANKRQSDRELRDLLQLANGQLIVGMIQATSGVPFTEKISSECSQLSNSALVMYGCIALVTAENEAMDAAQIQDAVGGNENNSWRDLKSLERSRLIQLKPNTDRFEVRHRVIAEEVRNYLSKIGALATVVTGTLRAYAAAGALTRDRSNHSRRILIRLINHSYLIRTLGLSESKIRTIYDSVEDILDEDFHYWLQRGAFEVEIGDLKNAMHDLKSASTTVGGEDDPRVLTEFAVLRLKIAADNRTSQATTLALSALDDLQKVLRIQGTNAPHAFAILASAGVPWLRDALISRSEKRNYAEDALRMLSGAGSLLSTNYEVAQKLPTAIKVLEDLLAEL